MMATRRWPFWALIGVAALTLIGANVHLVYVAIVSQPDCVDHLKSASDGPG